MQGARVYAAIKSQEVLLVLLGMYNGGRGMK